MPTINKSIGTSSRDYSTITLWEADLDNGALYASGDTAIGECYNDSAFNEAVTINGGGTIGLTEWRLTVASGHRHNGIAGAGARIVRTANGSDSISVPNADPATKSVSWLEINHGGFAISRGVSDGSGTVRSCRIRHCLVHDAAVNAGSVLGITASSSSDVYDCIVYDVLNTQGAGGSAVGVQTTSGNAYNNTVHRITRNNGSGVCHGVNVVSAGSARNNYAGDCTGTTSGTKADVSATTQSYNASSDTSATGSGSLTSKAAANQFVSTTNGFEDYHLKSGADLINAGTDLGTSPSNIAFDIDGRDRDAENDVWDIGADEFVPVPGTYTATAALSVSSATLSAAATHTTPTFTAEAELTVSAAELSASAVSTEPTFLGTSELVASKAEIAAAAAYTDPVIYTAIGVLTSSAAILSSTAAATGPPIILVLAGATLLANLEAHAVTLLPPLQAYYGIQPSR